VEIEGYRVQKLIEDFLQNRGYTVALIDPKKIIYREEFAAKCQMNYCGRYGRSWSCPPAIGDRDKIQERATQFPIAFLYQKVFPLEDSYDYEGMEAGRRTIMKDTLTLHELLKREKTDYYILSSGSCSLCSECTYPMSPCRFPDKLLISMEALGIDVAVLAREYGLKYYHGPATTTYFALVFLGETND